MMKNKSETGNTGSNRRIDGDYVWYMSYGSNMFEKRFASYIDGGEFRGGGSRHEACEDKSAPRAVRACEIPYDMYFRNSSCSWDGGGVSFLDIMKPGRAKGVAYLITRKQFSHVACQENGGCPPEFSRGWYDTVVSLGIMDGYEVLTITNGETENYNVPSKAYLETLRAGLREHFPEMTEKEIRDYLSRCIR
ncbi:hypothetical protein [Hornefia butyriciproducens]|uniref:hypothetical protein n=1 Tax=Hornefia butyriciproducens TaxID=2652293 RepID=UPI003F88AE13